MTPADTELRARMRDHAPPRPEGVAREIADAVVRMHGVELLITVSVTIALILESTSGELYRVVAAVAVWVALVPPALWVARWKRRRHAAAVELGRHGLLHDGVLCLPRVHWAVHFDPRGRARLRRWRGSLAEARVAQRLSR